MYGRHNIRTGMQVYSSDGQQVGSIGDVGQTHFRCDTGFLGLGKDLYVPFNSVDRVEGDRCYLNVVRDRIGQMSWDRQPVGWTS
jgi:hypothetical protein